MPISPETRLRRHAQLWESGTGSARRAAIGGVIFAILMLLRVVEPYHQVEKDGEQERAALVVQEAKLLRQQNQLARIEGTLKEIEDELEREPWNVEKNKLIEYFQNRRSGGSEDLAVPQDKANETILNIVELVENGVVEKLRAVMTAPETSERLANYPDKIQDAVNQWKAQNYNNTKWYFTQGSKEETIRGMSQVLSALKTEALAAVNESRATIPEKKADIDRDKSEIQEKLKNAQKNIKADLNQILPSWAQDSVGVKSMMIFYPWLLVAVAAYLVTRALVAARHFHGMADEEQWTAEERSDPLVSSTWTLTWRGFAGTAVAVGNYVAVIVVLWFCLMRAGDPPSTDTGAAGAEASASTTVEASSNALADAMAAVLPVDLAHGLLLAALAVVVATPVWRLARRPDSH